MKELKDTISKYEKIKKEFEREKEKKKHLEEQKKEFVDALTELEAEESDNLLKKELLEQASEKAREDGMRVLSDTATNAVQAILGEDTFVDMVSTIRNGVPNVDVVVKREKNNIEVITDPTQGEGGGVADIVALSMFFSLGLLVGHDNEAPIFMDEPTKFLSKGYSTQAAAFINEMVDYTGKQTFMVTHDETIASSGDKVFRTELNDELVSEVTEVEL